MNVLQLTIDGGIFMIPLFGLSILAVTMAVERFIGLRRLKVLPDPLVAELGQLGGSQGGFDPRKAYRICQQYPSAAARVIRAMLLKVGRPLSEVEHTVKEVSEREATRMYSNVRWLNLCSSISTLIGLLGTVQGMILAFHKLTLIGPGENKATALAEGIYVALVTTFAGLCIAIPAGAFAHFFEGRIQSLFHEIDELVFNLLPQVERYEGRVRFSRQGEDGVEQTAQPTSQPMGTSASGS
jgi:biopolymer transport protein ExbB